MRWKIHFTGRGYIPSANTHILLWFSSCRYDKVDFVICSIAAQFFTVHSLSPAYNYFIFCGCEVCSLLICVAKADWIQLIYATVYIDLIF